MPTLIVYVPFTAPQGAPQGDLRVNARDLAQAQFAGLMTRTGVAINNVVVVYRTQENHQVQLGDIVCVHAHGGPGADTSAGDNRGENVTLDQLLHGLDTLGAPLANACYFAMCFSSLAGHAAQVWKQGHANQRVFGNQSEMQGALALETRGGVRSSIFHPKNAQLNEVT
jgi:hypothetical protein